MYKIDSECREDGAEVEALFNTCFGDARFGLSSYRLRGDSPPVGALCFTIRDEAETLAAAIRFWEISVGAEPCLLLGPIGVHPTRQGEGFGAALIHHALHVAERGGWCHILLIGDLSYYARFGFSLVGNNVFYPPPTEPSRILGLSFGDDDLRFRLSGKVEKGGGDISKAGIWDEG